MSNEIRRISIETTGSVIAPSGCSEGKQTNTVVIHDLYTAQELISVVGALLRDVTDFIVTQDPDFTVEDIMMLSVASAQNQVIQETGEVKDEMKGDKQ